MAEDAVEDSEGVVEECPKCEECVPGLPGWMATFSDLVTLLLTFFVLLLSFAKTESAKYEAALGSIRNAFGGNVLKYGEVIQKGKSPDNSPTMIESHIPIKPFPIEFLTMEGLLDKHEINRSSDEELRDMKTDLNEYNLSESVDVYEVSEGIKVNVKDKIFFKKGSIEIVQNKISVEIFEKIIKLVKNENWVIFVEGHASKGETAKSEKGEELDAYAISAERAKAVSGALIRRGVKPVQITSVFYGDTRPGPTANLSGEEYEATNRRVEFIVRKRDLKTEGHKVESK